MRSKFEMKDNRPFSTKAKSFGQSMLFWRGRKKGMIHTRNIELDDFRYIFFPKGFEKYGYLGTQIWNEDGHYFKALYPLVLALDFEAKPKWCPRWFLRFLDVFGNDKSIVRVRNRKLHNLYYRITKGIRFVDYKTKWSEYDLRISINGPEHLQDLADDIESGFYDRGYKQYLTKYLKDLDPEAKPEYSIERLIKQVEEILNARESNKSNTGKELD